MSAALQALRGVGQADVYKKGELAAALRRQADGGVAFQYLAGYAGPAIATSLPLGARAVATTGGGLPAFFAGVLPEGHRLNVLRGAVKTSRDDELSLLLAVGGELPGDVTVLPSGATSAAVAAAAGGEPSELDFAALMEEPDLQGLAGVQDKLSASMLSTPVRFPQGEGILKLDPRDNPHLVVNELAHLEAARGLRLPVAQATLVTDRTGLQGLLVSRFDRVGSGPASAPVRLALEDAAQVLGILPAAKYSVTSEQVVQALAGVATAPLIAVRNLYLQFVFAWLTGNGDLHAKNVSVLEQADGSWAVSPVYDVPSTLVYGDNSMALSLDGRTTKLRARHWAAFADSIGLNQKSASSANRLAVGAAASVDWDALPFEGSVQRGVERELASRRRELEG